MSEIEIVKLLGQGGISAAALVILGRIVWKIGLRMIAAIDRLIDKIDVHSRADTAAWTEVNLKVTQSFQEVASGLQGFRREISQEMARMRQDLAVLGTRIETLLDLDDPESSLRRRTPMPRLDDGQAKPEPDRTAHRSRPHRTKET